MFEKVKADIERDLANCIERDAPVEDFKDCKTRCFGMVFGLANYNKAGYVPYEDIDCRKLGEWWNTYMNEKFRKEIQERM